MKTCRIADAIGRLDDDLIEGALHSAAYDAGAEQAKCEKASRKKFWTRVATVAATATIVVSSGSVALAVFIGTNKASGSNPECEELLYSVGGIGRYYTAEVSDDRFREIFPEEKIFPETYPFVAANGSTYSARGESVSQKYIGEKIGEAELPGGSGETRFAYAVKGIDKKRTIAVEEEGSFYLYANDYEVAPDTFGELWNAYDFDDTISLSCFVVGGREGEYVLSDPTACLRLLKGLGNSVALSDDSSVSVENAISFVVSSEAIGLYKREILVSENGILALDLFGEKFVYEIGKDKAKEIREYALSHYSVCKGAEPYEFKAWGEITEIGDGYFTISDEFFCVRGRHAVTFTVSTGNRSFGRYVAAGDLKVGDKIAVVFRGYIDAEHGNLIADGRKILKYREDKI